MYITAIMEKETWKGTINLISEDLNRLSKCQTFRGGVIKFITNYSFKITTLFRICSYMAAQGIIMRAINILPNLLLRYYQRKYGILLAPGTKIRGGLTFPHFGNIIINGGVIIGKNVTIFQGVTIGSVRGKGVPKIGNNVVISPNSILIGNITIGNNVFIGAGSVVTKSFPDNVTIAGNPAKIINNNGIYNCNCYI